MMQDIKMIDNETAIIHGVVINPKDWTEILIDPKLYTKLRNKFKNYVKSTKYEKMFVIKSTKSSKYDNEFRVIVAEISTDPGSNYTAAFIRMANATIDESGVVLNLEINNKRYLSACQINEITKTITSYFNHLYHEEDLIK